MQAGRRGCAKLGPGALRVGREWGRRLEACAAHPAFLVVLIGCFLGILAGYFFAWPIILTDTDLWYHLSGGRYAQQQGRIPREAYFSFIEPQKTWYNYYWLFQVIVFHIFRVSGYVGLIVLRGLLYVLTAFCLCLLLIRQRLNRGELVAGAFCVVAVALSILWRELLVRPHLFSYLFIVVFLLILERARHLAWLLPLLAVIWVNVHGIEFPVMFLIILAYLGEIYWRQLRGAAVPGDRRPLLRWSLIGTLYCIFLTPGVVELLFLPFTTAFEQSAQQHLYISELLPLSFRRLFILTPISVNGVLAALRSCAVFGVFVAFALLLWQRRLRLSHALLFAGALALLPRHGRFIYEFILLCVPLLYAAVQHIAPRVRLGPRTAAVVLVLLLAVLPLLVCSQKLGQRPAYPFSRSRLPVGSVAFLNAHCRGGRILNPPGLGGYLHWALDERFKIYMDLQMSLFSDLDFALWQHANHDPHVFAGFLETYDPTFLLLSVRQQEFGRRLAAEGTFVPVFLDHAQVLYVNRIHDPALAAECELRAIDPFGFQTQKLEDTDEQALNTMKTEATKLAQEDPQNYAAHLVLAGIANLRGQHRQAQDHAEVLQQYYRELPEAHALAGDAFLGLEQHDKAVPCYRKAMRLGQATKAARVYWNLHLAYARQGQQRKAYRLLGRYVNPFSPAAEYREIYQLGMAAMAVGRRNEAVTFLSIAQMKTPAADEQFTAKVNQGLESLAR